MFCTKLTGLLSYLTGKLGLLPKRPVSLLKPQVAAGGQTVVERQTSVDDDDDELEYTENPFEDHRS